VALADAKRLSAAEAAFVLNELPKTVRKALDEGPIEATLVQSSSGAVRMLDRVDVIYLYAANLLKRELTSTSRQELYHAMKRKLSRQMAFGRIRIDIADAVDVVDQRLARLAELKSHVDFSDGGDPMIKGTDIEVHRIAALLDGGMTSGEISEDYPGIAQGQVEAAREFAAAYPKPGRPYPKTTFKRLLRTSRLHELDDVLADE